MRDDGGKRNAECGTTAESGTRNDGGECGTRDDSRKRGQELGTWRARAGDLEDESWGSGVI